MHYYSVTLIDGDLDADLDVLMVILMRIHC
jgi:hypothetical protein